MPQNDIIDVTDLRRRYGPRGRQGFDAVRGVTFRVRRGELFALLGTNGAGKTSVLEVVEGLAAATSGSVRVLGLDPYRQRRHVRPRTGVMLQEGGFASDLTVTEAARMWAGTLTSPRPVAEALELVSLQHRGSVTVKQLSGGERRRLDLAVALLGRPEVLFLDEPTTGLDPESRRNTWRLLGDLLAEGTTILLTTHYLEEAESLADRLAIMHRGCIVQMGTPAQIARSQPARITFQLPPGVVLPALPAAVASQGARQTVLETHDMQHTLTALLRWAADHTITLTGLDARTASLEQAFLAVADSASQADAAGQTDGHGSVVTESTNSSQEVRA